VPSIEHQNKTNRNFDRLAIVRTVLVQVLVLLALTGAVVWYVNWSSDVAMKEFMSANKPPLFGPNHHPRAQVPVQAAKGKMACARKI
jgi:hypothetical protein